MIKNLKPNKKSTFKQGYYPIKEAKKYAGTTKVIYRSSWERKFCDWCETNSNVKSWKSESVEIKYFDSNDKKEHRYYPDFLIQLQDDTIILIEVKPESQIREPKKPKRMTAKAKRNYLNAFETYRKNMLKFNAAVKYCAKRGWVFKIITESFFKKHK